MDYRGASEAVVNEATKDQNRPIYLMELYLDGALTLATNAYKDIVWDGKVYPAIGHFGDFDQVEESTGLKVNVTNVSLSGVSQEVVASILEYEYMDRRLVLRRAFLDDAGQVLVDPYPILDGRCDAPSLEEDPESGKSTVNIPVGSHWTDFERKSGRHANHEEQQIWFPGDKGFEFVAGLANKDVKWGAA